MKPGDMVRVSNHTMEGYEWTRGQIGVLMSNSHIRNFDVQKAENAPPILPYWWIVQVEHKIARGGYALAPLPEKHMTLHTCTESCPKHLNMEANVSCAT